MTTKKAVTYNDRETLRKMRGVFLDGTPQASLLNHLIAVAEADAPPLPDDWVLYYYGGHWNPYWHEQGYLYRGKDVDGGTSLVGAVGDGRYTRDRLTTLHPAIDSETLEKVAQAAKDEYNAGRWDDVSFPNRYLTIWSRVARAVLTAAGLQVDK